MDMRDEKDGEELRALFDGRAGEAPDGHALLGNVHRRSRRMLQRRTGITAGALAVLAATGVVAVQNLGGEGTSVAAEPSASSSAEYPYFLKLMPPPGELTSFPLYPGNPLGDEDSVPEGFAGDYWYTLDGRVYTFGFLYTPQNGATDEQIYGGASPVRSSLVYDTGPGVSLTDGEELTIRGAPGRIKVTGDDIVLSWSELGREWRVRAHLLSVAQVKRFTEGLYEAGPGVFCNSSIGTMREWGRPATDSPPEGAREIDFYGKKGYLVGTEADSGSAHAIYFTGRDGTPMIVSPPEGFYATDDELIGETTVNLWLSCHLEPAVYGDPGPWVTGVSPGGDPGGAHSEFPLIPGN
ncbi:hypothetical protein Afil01_45260 [Actinorhabdospora filicis]|uniref:Uncharacterized protein n=1 Tax=Actinorhabdospora filicis TaxID=1785913 RepID=A0A9W6SPN1_9ACTN|nr:hypothetical protein [Actinorhabdospora filicis]GLZ79719.1 hypothetical protein Afil01_45260 [Actinorhabdospora filicis]